MNRKENFTAGFIRENPVFSLYLGLCSTLAIDHAEQCHRYGSCCYRSIDHVQCDHFPDS